MLRELHRLFRHIGGGARYVGLLALRSPFEIAHTYVQAAFFSSCFDAAAIGDQTKLYRALIAFSISVLILYLYNGSVWSVYSANGVRISGRVRRLLFTRLEQLPFRQMEERSTGEWFSRMNNDVKAATAAFNQPFQLPHATLSGLKLLISIGVLLWMNPMIAIAVIAFLIPHMLASYFIVVKPYQPLTKRALLLASENAAALETAVTCAEIAISYSAQDFLLRACERASEAIRQNEMKMAVREAIGGIIVPLFSLSGYLTLLALGGLWIAQGSMTVGDMMGAFQFRGGVIVGAMMLQSCLMSMQSSASGMRRVNDMLDEDGGYAQTS